MGRVLVRFRDNRGSEWEAWEVGTPADASDEHEITGQYPKYPRSSWLCFYSSKERRRLAEYPFKWYKLSVDRLTALLAKATPQRVSPRDIVLGRMTDSFGEQRA